MNWKNYIHQNSMGLMDCQLVTAVNAHYHLTGKIIKQNSEQYEYLAKIAGCCYGSCTNIKKVWKELGILEDKRFNCWEIDKYLKPNTFIEAGVWNKHYNYHSISIVDYSHKTQAVRVTNFKYETSTMGWIFVEDLVSFYEQI